MGESSGRRKMRHTIQNIILAVAGNKTGMFPSGQAADRIEKPSELLESGGFLRFKGLKVLTCLSTAA